MFARMARNEDIADEKHQGTTQTMPDCNNFLLDGIKVIQKETREGRISRLKLHFLWDAPPGEEKKQMVQEHATKITEGDHDREEEDACQTIAFKI
jgi:hypothetical protein